jgi:multidrug transporter EmrE-like cation transporter
MIRTTVKTDKVGIIASTLCMIHCIATPFLFLAKSCSASCCEASPSWWSSLDFLFLTVSFFAIYQSNKNSSKTYIKYALWTSWGVLLAVLLNEKFQLLALAESAIYFPAMMLVILHVYNSRYCQCKAETCYTN